MTPGIFPAGSMAHLRTSPVAAIEPIVDPWYERYRAMILVLPVTILAILKAASLASVPGRREEVLFQSGREDFEQQRAQFRPDVRGKCGGNVREPARLFFNRPDDRLVLVAQCHAHEL